MRSQTKILTATRATTAPLTVGLTIAQAPQKARKDRQKVLDTLTPEEESKQPSPASTAMKVMQKQGTSNTPDAGVTIETTRNLGPLGGSRMHVCTLADGVPVAHEVYKGITHAAFGIAAIVPQAKKDQDFAVGALKKSLQSRGNTVALRPVSSPGTTASGLNLEVETLM